MEIRIIDTPRTVTVDDIAPGKEFVFSGNRYLKTAETRNDYYLCVWLTKAPGATCYFKKCGVPVEPCEPPTPATCTFGELEPGDLFNLGSQPTSQVYQKQMDACPNAVNLTSDHTCKIRNDEIVTPLEQVEPLVLRTRS